MAIRRLDWFRPVFGQYNGAQRVGWFPFPPLIQGGNQPPQGEKKEVVPT